MQKIQLENSKPLDPAKQILLIESIIKISILDSESKALILKNSGDALTKTIILDYLIGNNLIDILQFYLISDLEIKLFDKAPPPNSSFDWTNEELDYYRIKMVEVKSLTDLLDDVYWKQGITLKAANFLQENEKFDSIPFNIDSNQLEYTVFQRNCIKLFFESQESRINDLIQEFLINVLDLKIFDISTNYPLELLVAGSIQEVNPDFVIMYWPKKLSGTLIVKYKKRKLTKRKKDKAEAQAIAGSIAIAQQKNWPKDLPVYFFKFWGTELTAYRSLYNFELLDSVRKGHRRTEPYIIYKYAPRTFGTRHEGLDLLKPKDRKNIVQFFCAIQKYYEDKLK